MEHIRDYCETGNMMSLARIDRDDATFALELAPYVLEKYPEYDNVYHQRALNIKELFSRSSPIGDIDCPDLRGLYNIGASCYLDSALFALFAVSNWFVNATILEAPLRARDGPRFDCADNVEDEGDIEELSEKQNIDLENRRAVQVQLQAIAASIRGAGDVKYCTDLRGALRNCPNAERYHRRGEKDAGEFLGYILSMFDTNVAHKRVTTVATHDLGDNPEELVDISVSNDNNASIVQFVDNAWLSSVDQDQSHFISEFLAQIDDVEFDDKNLFYHGGVEYERKIARRELISTPYLIFNLQRKGYVRDRRGRLRERTIRTRVIPSETLTIYDGSRFKLSAMVLHEGNHYMASFKCGDQWYFYNDLGGRITLIGTYGEMLRHNPNPITHVTVYYYVPTQ